MKKMYRITIKSQKYMEVNRIITALEENWLCPQSYNLNFYSATLIIMWYDKLYTKINDILDVLDNFDVCVSVVK